MREVFEYETLDFDEIMQRDIDDARVSAELIPYLLDEKSVDLIKLFPPISRLRHADRGGPEQAGGQVSCGRRKMICRLKEPVSTPCMSSGQARSAAKSSDSSNRSPTVSG